MTPTSCGTCALLGQACEQSNGCQVIGAEDCGELVTHTG
jgi:hypothetical protein